jgi:hypothetical protein
MCYRTSLKMQIGQGEKTSGTRKNKKNKKSPKNKKARI